jgi:hypothetical protein
MSDACPKRSDGGPHLHRYPPTLMAQLLGAEYSCAYCGAPLPSAGVPEDVDAAGEERGDRQQEDDAD